MPDILLRAEARASSQTKYFTGKPCKSGHIAERYTASRKCHECAKALHNQWQRRNPDYYANKHLVQNYGLSLADRKALVDVQNGCCAGCTKPFVGTPNVDHDHITGAVRELLCTGCNTALGAVQDNPDTLRKLISYLSKHSNPTSRP